jgi:hypothetical protein
VLYPITEGAVACGTSAGGGTVTPAAYHTRSELQSAVSQKLVVCRRSIFGLDVAGASSRSV